MNFLPTNEPNYIYRATSSPRVHSGLAYLLQTNAGNGTAVSTFHARYNYYKYSIQRSPSNAAVNLDSRITVAPVEFFIIRYKLFTGSTLCHSADTRRHARAFV